MNLLLTLHRELLPSSACDHDDNTFPRGVEEGGGRVKWGERDHR